MDVMLDLETLSSRPDAAIVAIGAVTFSTSGVPLKPDERKTFYCVVDANSAQITGGRIDASTVKWWAQQSNEARAVLNDDSAQPAFAALMAFKEFFSKFGVERVWGNGASFDNVVLRQAFERLTLAAPWTYRNERCYRTLKNMFPFVEFSPKGTEHNALDDAVAQAEHAEQIFSYIAAVKRDAAKFDEDFDLSDFETEEIADEFYSRLGDGNLAHEALAAIKEGRTLDAVTALERLTNPKWHSAGACKHAYDAAMAAKRAAMKAAA